MLGLIRGRLGKGKGKERERGGLEMCIELQKLLFDVHSTFTRPSFRFSLNTHLLFIEHSPVFSPITHSVFI